MTDDGMTYIQAFPTEVCSCCGQKIPSSLPPGGRSVSRRKILRFLSSQNGPVPTRELRQFSGGGGAATYGKLRNMEKRGLIVSVNDENNSGYLHWAINPEYKDINWMTA